MYRFTLFAAILMMSVMLIIGCSGLAPTSPETVGVPRAVDTDTHFLLGYYHLILDPSGPTVDVAPARDVDAHFNVTQFVSPPACLDCIKTQPLGPYQNQTLNVNVTIKNPTAITGFDVRGILLSDDPGLGLNNPDNYTSIFDNGGPVTINPFKAFAKANPTRSFAAGESWVEEYDLHLSSFGKITIIDYVIDANFPKRVSEPYQIGIPKVNGEIDDLGANSAKITVDVQAAGEDVDEVLMDASSMGFSSNLPLSFVGGKWSLDFINEHLSPVGDYKCLIKASTASSTKYLYQYFTLTVVPGIPPTSLADDVQPLFNQYCTLCHSGVAPPQGLNLSAGNAYSNLVNVDSVESTAKRVAPGQSFASYLSAKINGNHLQFPFNGSGQRMPLNGPPYLTFPESALISLWIDQGALDN